MVGMSFLGAVREIGDMDLIIALPNNLAGIVPIASISEPLERAATAVAVALADADSSDSDAEDTTISGLPQLDKLFHVGQLVRCVATSLEIVKGSKRIELSTKPSLVNVGIPSSAFVKGFHIGGCIESVEDTGYVVSFGDHEIKGFAPIAEVSETLAVGALVECVVQKMKGRVATVSLAKSAISEAVANTAVLPVTAIKPGVLVQGLVKRCNEQGAVVDINGAIGTIDRYHLPKQLKISSRVTARVLWADSGARRLGLSLLPSLIKYDDMVAPAHVPVGSKVNVEIVRIDGELGMLVKVIDSKPVVHGFVHISRVADERVEKLEKRFTAGEKYPARVVGLSLLDGIVNISMAPSVVNAQWLRLDDLKPGMLVKCTIASVHPYGLLVNLTEHIRGLVPLLHLADSRISNPVGKFKVGKSIECRVLSVDSAKKRLFLTHKRTLLKTELPLLTSYEDAKKDLIVHGYILRVVVFLYECVFY